MYFYNNWSLKHTRFYFIFLILRQPLPTVFSMLHPLDEIAPVIYKPAGMTHTVVPHK